MIIMFNHTFYANLNNETMPTANTRFVHWLAVVHFGCFAPAFTLSLGDSEHSCKSPNAHRLCF